MRPWIGVFFALVVVMGRAAPVSAETDLAAMKPEEIAALQARLADAGCYAGAIDGQASPSTEKAVASCPDQAPVLRIETGMHVAQISRIGVDAACRTIATASDDKTLRLWPAPDGRLLHTIRLPIGEGALGKVYATVMSPDGRWLAAGGYDAAFAKGQGNGLYLVDLASGGVRRFGSYQDIINDLAFSADGRRIAVGFDRIDGVRVLDRATGRELMVDRAYGNAVLGLAFGPDGSLIATSLDGSLRRYGPDLKLEARVKAPDGVRPYQVAIDPTGRRAAVGYDDDAAVSVLNAATATPVAKAGSGDLPNRNLASVAWFRDGRTIVAGGNAGDPHVLRRLGPTGNRLGPDSAASSNTILDLQPCGTGVAFAAADPSFGLMSADASVRTLQGPVTADMRDKVGDAFTVSADLGRIRFGLGSRGNRPVLFDLAGQTLTDAPSPMADLKAATVEGLPVSDWLNRPVPKLKGVPIELYASETSRALAILPDRSGFVLGASFSLRAFDAAGKARWTDAVPAEAWGAAFSAGGRVLAVAYGDGTIRWHRWSDGRELLALFVDAKDRRWIAWTPTGYYLASPGAEDLIGWHINRGWEQQADFFPASRFRDKFNRPDVVQAVLKTLDEGEALRQADAVAQKRPDAKPLIERLPPVITILSPADGASAVPGTVEIRYRVRMPSGGKMDRVDSFVDGARIEARGLGPANPDGTGSVIVPMPARDAAISLVAYADGKASDAARIQLKGQASTGPTRDDAAPKPNLYALLIGVAHYDVAGYDLAFPAQDAAGLAAALQSQQGRLYGQVEVKVLTDKDATAAAVKRGLTWLKRQTTARDLAIVFAAGHGTTDAKGRFWFLSSDMDPNDIEATAVSQDDIENQLFDLPGKKLLFLDACHAGAALNAGARGGTDVSAAISDFAQTEGGVVAYAASTGREFSFERDDWGHGAFTKALIEGLGGQAATGTQGIVTTATLDLFVERRVKELTDGRQHPVMTRPKIVPDFPIAALQ